MKRIAASFSILCMLSVPALAQELLGDSQLTLEPERKGLFEVKAPQADPEVPMPTQDLPELSLPAIPPPQEVACACGCNMFSVGSPSFLDPTNAQGGLSIWFRYNFVNQNQNYEGSSRAPRSDNADKQIKSNFFTFGAQYAIDHDWAVLAELPVYGRAFKTTDDGTYASPDGTINTRRFTGLGDLKLMGMYTGFSDDRSTGLQFGIKLPTGDFTGPYGPLGGAGFDRDTLLGTGSTDLVIGAYHFGGLTDDNKLSYFVQANFQFAVATQDGYRPGNELTASAGLTYNFGEVGPFTRLAPVLGLIGNLKAADSGVNSDPLNTGYRRLYFAPGLEMRFDHFKVYGDIELPIYQYYNYAIPGTSDSSGQLAAPIIYKVQVGYDF